jgi:hypothetical protein
MFRVNKERLKRAVLVNGIPRALSLYVEYLIVLDSSVYNDFVALYSNIRSSLLTQYISIYFSQLVNSVSYLK